MDETEPIAIIGIRTRRLDSDTICPTEQQSYLKQMLIGLSLCKSVLHPALDTNIKQM